jgi:hypothetical protein
LKEKSSFYLFVCFFIRFILKFPLPEALKAWNLALVYRYMYFGGREGILATAKTQLTLDAESDEQMENEFTTYVYKIYMVI